MVSQTKGKNEEGFLYVDYSDKYGNSSSNQKLQFCRDMLSLQNQYNITREGEKRDEQAYSLAFIPVQPWYTIGYDNNYNEIFVPQHNAMQYKAMAELERFALRYPEDVDDYTTKCDMLKRFMASNR